MISGNSAKGWGGGVDVNAGTLDNCVISGNSASGYQQYVGGVQAYDSEINNCVISGNSATWAIGGVSLNGGSSMKYCIVRNNTGASSIGGVSISSWSNMKNCLVVGNKTLNTGAGIQTGHNAYIYNCTVVSNKSNSATGNGVYLAGSGVYLRNSIVWGNVPSNAVSNATRSGGGDTYNCSDPLLTGESNICVNPRFVNTNAGNYRLTGYSPCKDVGKNSYMTLPYDLDGEKRIWYGTVDMGAFEAVIRGSIITIQ